MCYQCYEDSNKDRIHKFLKLIDEEFVPPLSERVCLDDYSCKLSKKACNLFVVRGGVDIAHVAFYCNDKERSIAYISSLGILSAYYGSGAAGYLLEKVCDECRNKKMLLLRLQVYNGNVRSVKFYQKHGFTFFSANIMEKSLLMNDLCKSDIYPDLGLLIGLG
ncbi:GNAT family N-acetyltransferase [Halomonas sp. MES3-P3E]|uniref:GNAT family N-acetyltransferase n=1 Tax=Halomonas sp. MES3-P3E TaxID=2058321 RepID=UPI000C34263B|nr:GNAT family N-acetyltransferase [Halomonas sp. MES3-P3E]PKG54900.1 hypothetical protein CXF87_01010 [Halomonas sp. MES3-P3E]